MPLLITDIVAHKLKSSQNHSRSSQRWRIQVAEDVVDPNCCLEDKLLQVYLQNGGDQVFEFQMSYSNLVNDHLLKNAEKLFYKPEEASKPAPTPTSKRSMTAQQR